MSTGVLGNIHLYDMELFFAPLCLESSGKFIGRFKFKYNGKVLECESKMISDFLFAEYQFRVATQLKVGFKSAPTHEMGVKYAMRETNLFLKELAMPPLALPSALSKQDPKWYLSHHHKLVDYCKQSGGCCGRSCGCCSKREPVDRPSTAGISGHCTWGCRCCMKSKGLGDYYSWAPEGSQFEEQYNAALESNNPTVLLHLADAYFSPEPIPQPAAYQESAKGPKGKVKSSSLEPGPCDNAKATTKKTTQNGAMDEGSDSSPPPYEHSVNDDRDMREGQGSRIDADELGSTTSTIRTPANGGVTASTATLPWLKKSFKSRK